MLELVKPTIRLRSSWLAAHHEWGPGRHEDGFGIGPDDDVESDHGFAAWVERLRDDEQAGPTGGTCRWIVEGDLVHGGIALRHAEHPHALRNGHVGFGLRPGSRGRGIAREALRQMLMIARDHGMDRVLLVCLADNLASARTIEKAGGVLEADASDGAGVRRYWILTTESAATRRPETES